MPGCRRRLVDVAICGRPAQIVILLLCVDAPLTHQSAPPPFRRRQPSPSACRPPAPVRQRAPFAAARRPSSLRSAPSSPSCARALSCACAPALTPVRSQQPITVCLTSAAAAIPRGATPTVGAPDLPNLSICGSNDSLLLQPSQRAALINQQQRRSDLPPAQRSQQLPASRRPRTSAAL